VLLGSSRTAIDVAAPQTKATWLLHAHAVHATATCGPLGPHGAAQGPPPSQNPVPTKHHGGGAARASRIVPHHHRCREEESGVTASSAYSVALKLKVNSPLLLALFRDSRQVCMTMRKRVGLRGHPCFTPTVHGSATGSPLRSKVFIRFTIDQGAARQVLTPLFLDAQQLSPPIVGGQSNVTPLVWSLSNCHPP
jgi:hypothetical protein